MYAHDLLRQRVTYTPILTPFGILCLHNHIIDKILHHDSFDSERNIKIIHFDSGLIMY